MGVSDSSFCFVWFLGLVLFSFLFFFYLSVILIHFGGGVRLLERRDVQDAKMRAWLLQ